MAEIDDEGRFRIGHLPTFYHTSPLLMAGVGPAGPIPARWELFPTGPAMMDAFAEGRLDIGYIGLPPAMIGIARGVVIRCVAGGHMDGTILTGRPELRSLEQQGGDLRATLAQFIGKAVGTPAKGSIHDVILRHFLRETDLEEEVELTNYKQADLMVDALAEGELDGAAGTPALAVAAKRFAGAKLLVPPGTLWPNNPSYGIVAGAKICEESPERLEAFLKAHEEATQLIRKRPGEAAAITAKVVGLVGEDFVLETYRLSPRYCAALPPEYIDATMAFVPVLIEHGYVPHRLEVKDVFDLRFISRVHPGADHYGEGLA